MKWVDYRSHRFEDVVHDVDVVLDTIGGPTQEASWATLKRGGILVATAMPPPAERAAAVGVRATFVFTRPRGAVLAELAERVDAAACAYSSAGSSRSPMRRRHTGLAKAGGRAAS